MALKAGNSMIRDAAIRALDKAADKFADAGKDADRLVHRLARKWSGFSDEEKREIAEVVVAAASVVGFAVVTMREKGSKKTKAKKIAKKAGKGVLKRLVLKK